MSGTFFTGVATSKFSRGQVGLANEGVENVDIQEWEGMGCSASLLSRVYPLMFSALYVNLNL